MRAQSRGVLVMAVALMFGFSLVGGPTAASAGMYDEDQPLSKTCSACSPIPTAPA